MRLGVAVLSLRRRSDPLDAHREGQPEAQELLRLAAALPAVCVGSARTARALSARTIAARLGATRRRGAREILSPEHLGLLDQALVLCADHALDTPALAARVTASAGGNLYACMAAGLDAISGGEHAGVCTRVEEIVSDLKTPDAVHHLAIACLDRGREIPGFGHSLYPGRDPRATPLIEAAVALAPDDRRIRNLPALVEAAGQHGAPTLEVGLVALSAALDLPRGMAAAILAVGRIAGLVAHVLEEWAHPARSG